MAIRMLTHETFMGDTAKTLEMNLLFVRTEERWSGTDQDLARHRRVFPADIAGRLVPRGIAIGQMDDEADGRAALEQIAARLVEEPNPFTDAMLAIAATGNVLQLRHENGGEPWELTREIHERDPGTGTYRTRSVTRF